MPLSHSLLPEFDQEAGHTRKTLERVPDDKLSWKPHEKSMTMGRLAAHLAEIPTWAVATIERDSIDIAPIEGPPYQPPAADSRQAILALFEQNLAAARAAIAKCSDERFMQRWTLLAGGKQIFTLPRIAVIRSMIMNHAVHHRAQLGVYLRMNDVPLPAIYGPSADEGGMEAAAS
jgi:uncharacterized damage-inducible protein DinB